MFRVMGVHIARLGTSQNSDSFAVHSCSEKDCDTYSSEGNVLDPSMDVRIQCAKFSGNIICLAQSTTNTTHGTEASLNRCCAKWTN